MNQISITLNGRTVSWQLSEAQSTQMMQSLVQALGPAMEGG